jgi:hypothetical protein
MSENATNPALQDEVVENAASVSAKIKCTFNGCTNEKDERKMNVPSFPALTAKLGRDVKPEELASYAVCNTCVEKICAAARQLGRSPFFYNLADAVARSRHYHAELQAKAQKEEEARQRLERQCDDYASLCSKNGARHIVPAADLPTMLKCVFGDCGYTGVHYAMAVPALGDIELALGRNAETGDLSHFAVCIEHRRLLEKRCWAMNTAAIVAKTIANLAPQRREAAAVVAYLEMFSTAPAQTAPPAPKPAAITAPKPVPATNLVALNTGARKCAARDCKEILPADAEQSVCADHAHACNGGCGTIIPIWHKHCRQCLALQPMPAPNSNNSKKDLPAPVLKKRAARSARDRELRAIMRGKTQGGGGNGSHKKGGKK